MEIRMRLTISFALMLLASGCLDYEEQEIRILREQGEPAVTVIENVNIYSDKSDIAAMREDFDDLIEAWRGRELLDESAKDGYLIKSRELFIRDGRIVSRQTGIIQGLKAPEGDLRLTESQIMWTFEADAEIVETNGQILKTDSQIIVWPKEAPELRVKTHQRLKQSFTTTQPQMVQLLQEYIAKINKGQ